MTFAAYLIVAAGSVSHLALFQETAIKLPILAAELPLVAFFAIAPFFLLLFHFYLFLNLVALSRRISTYNRVLVKTLPQKMIEISCALGSIRSWSSSCFPGRPRREVALTAWLLNIVVWITLVGVPILILLQFQLTFLPYHLSVVTWIHRFLIVADLTLIWFFWFAIYRRGKLHFPRLKAHPIALGFSAVVIFISIFVVAYPGERLAGISERQTSSWCVRTGPFRFPIAFLRGPVNMVTGRPRRYFFNVLVLPDQTLTDPEKANAGQIDDFLARARPCRRNPWYGRTSVWWISRAQNLMARGWTVRGRQELFLAATIPAILTQNADWPDHGCSSLRGASLLGANLSGAHFSGARMEGSVLIDANLSGANLRNVHLEARDPYQRQSYCRQHEVDPAAERLPLQYEPVGSDAR